MLLRYCSNISIITFEIISEKQELYRGCQYQIPVYSSYDYNH